MFRTRETRPGPGALYTPGTAVPHGHVCIPRPPPAALQRPVPVTPVSRPVPGCLSHEASARVHWRSPLPAIPLACGSQTERDPSGFLPGFTPGRAGPGRACRGGDRPQALTWNNAAAISDLLRRIHSQRATSRRNAPARCPLRSGSGSVSNSIVPVQRAPFASTRPNETLLTRWIEAKGVPRRCACRVNGNVVVGSPIRVGVYRLRHTFPSQIQGQIIRPPGLLTLRLRHERRGRQEPRGNTPRAERSRPLGSPHER
jgi:hypothetical protein